MQVQHFLSRGMPPFPNTHPQTHLAHSVPIPLINLYSIRYIHVPLPTDMSETRATPRIKYVRAYTQTASAAGNQGADCHDVADDHWIDGGLAPIACPMATYPQYRASRKSWGINALGTLVVEVEDEEGRVGVGVTIGGVAGCQLVEGHLSRFVEGCDPRDVERMWDQMFRATLNYGRKGLPLQAISAVDLALWDLLGKVSKTAVTLLLFPAKALFFSPLPGMDLPCQSCLFCSSSLPHTSDLCKPFILHCMYELSTIFFFNHNFLAMHYGLFAFCDNFCLNIVS